MVTQGLGNAEIQVRDLRGQDATNLEMGGRETWAFGPSVLHSLQRQDSHLLVNVLTQCHVSLCETSLFDVADGLISSHAL